MIRSAVLGFDVNTCFREVLRVVSFNKLLCFGSFARMRAFGSFGVVRSVFACRFDDTKCSFRFRWEYVLS